MLLSLVREGSIRTSVIGKTHVRGCLSKFSLSYRLSIGAHQRPRVSTALWAAVITNGYFIHRDKITGRTKSLNKRASVSGEFELTVNFWNGKLHPHNMTHHPMLSLGSKLAHRTTTVPR